MRNRLDWLKYFALRYAVAVLAVTAAVIANLLLETYLQASPTLFLFLCSVVFATWFGGVGPGLAATAMSILAFDYFFLAPIYSLNYVSGFSAHCLVRDGGFLCRWTDGYAKKYCGVSLSVAH